jgi:hypothetical protein
VVEFALVLPLIAIFVLFLLGAGKLIFYWNNATQVANEGARLAVVNAGPTFPGGYGYEDYLERHAFKLGGDDPSLKVRVDFLPVGTAVERKPGSAVRVWVCRVYRLPFFIPDLQIRANATMRVERPVSDANIPETGDCDS